jgi:hypothetical protein
MKPEPILPAGTAHLWNKPDPAPPVAEFPFRQLTNESPKHRAGGTARRAMGEPDRALSHPSARTPTRSSKL